ncbi:MAG: hypothetical protein QW270_06410 [Candidatus Bathyarchaeia archaeon]
MTEYAEEFTVYYEYREKYRIRAFEVRLRYKRGKAPAKLDAVMITANEILDQLGIGAEYFRQKQVGYRIVRVPSVPAGGSWKVIEKHSKVTYPKGLKWGRQSKIWERWFRKKGVVLA